MAERMKRICFFVPRRMQAELARLSQFDGRSRGEIVRSLIEQRIEQLRQQEVPPKQR